MTTRTRLIAVLGLTVGICGAAQAETIIDTTEGADIASSRTTGAWPEGQTFLVPHTDTVLSSFTYYVQGVGGAHNVPLAIEIYAWDQSSFDTAGPSLWHGDGLFSDKNNGQGWVQSITELTFAPNIHLEGGMNYAFTFQMYGPGNFLLAMSGYEGGEGIVNVNGTGWSTWTIADAPLKMTFTSPIPEPLTYTLMMTGLVLVGVGACRRKKAEA